MTADQLNPDLKNTPAGSKGREKMITQSATQVKAIGLIHLYFEPSVHGPGSNLLPMRQRR